MKKNKFKSVLIIGMGLIGSSISRAFKEKKISDKIYGLDSNIDVLDIVILPSGLNASSFAF